MTARAARGVALLALAALVGGAGCASATMGVAGSGWAKPATGVQQVTFDEMDCARAAQGTGRTPDLVLGGVFDVARLVIDHARERGTFERCMAGRGYRQAAARSDRRVERS